MKKLLLCQSPDAGLLLLRLGLASVFIAHGWAKFADLDQTVGFFGSLGLSAFFAYLVAAVELLGGIAMLLGVWTKAAGYLLAVVMIFAIVLVKYKTSFFGGWEIDFVLLVMALAVAMIGPGKYALKPCTACLCHDSAECKRS